MTTLFFWALPLIFFESLLAESRNGGFLEEWLKSLESSLALVLLSQANRMAYRDQGCLSEREIQNTLLRWRNSVEFSWIPLKNFTYAGSTQNPQCRVYLNTPPGVFIASGVLKVKACWSSLNKPYRALCTKVNIWWTSRKMESYRFCLFVLLGKDDMILLQITVGTAWRWSYCME